MGGAKAGSVAGSIDTITGYLRITIDGRRYLGQRLAFLYMTGAWPADKAEHENLDRADNRWANLRPATNSQNQMNTRAKSSNKHGFKGVSLHKASGKFRAQITAGNDDRKRRHIGLFETAEQAATAYDAEARSMHGEFARVNFHA